MKTRLIVFGLDGGAFRLLKPWMDQGHLPFLQDMEVAGSCGPLESSIPPVTVPAWPCFMTGKNPGKHGVYFFFRSKPGSYEEIPISSASLDASTLWELLGREGVRVAVLNVPATYPPHPVNGIMVTDLKVTGGGPDLTYPPDLQSDIEQRFGPYRLTINTPAALLANQSHVNIDYFLRECREILDYKCRVATWLMEREEPDFVMLHILESDRLQHWLWNLLDPSHPKHDERLAIKYYDQILDYYKSFDAHISAMSHQAGPQATIIVMSDHGFGMGSRAIDLSTWLLQEGYLKIKDEVVSQIKLRLWRKGWTPGSLARFFVKNVTGVHVTHGLITRINKLAMARGRPKAVSRLRRTVGPFFLSSDDIDWARTKAYCLRGPGQIRMNLKGREPRGIVTSGSEYRALTEEISAKLEAMLDPESGRLIGGRAYIKEKVYHGKHIDQLPDITYVPLDGGISAVNLVDFKSNKVVIEDILATGIHRSDGILMAKGPMIRPATKVEAANIMDLAPTILYLMGAPVPQDMDGRILREMITDRFLEDHEIRLDTESQPDAVQDHNVTPDEEQKVLERLRGWGYID